MFRLIWFSPRTTILSHSANYPIERIRKPTKDDFSSFLFPNNPTGRRKGESNDGTFGKNQPPLSTPAKTKSLYVLHASPDPTDGAMRALGTFAMNFRAIRSSLSLMRGAGGASGHPVEGRARGTSHSAGEAGGRAPKQRLQSSVRWTALLLAHRQGHRRRSGEDASVRDASSGTIRHPVGQCATTSSRKTLCRGSRSSLRDEDRFASFAVEFHIPPFGRVISLARPADLSGIHGEEK